MEEIEITFGRVARIWWAWSWRTGLFSILIGSVIGFVIGFISAMFRFKQAGGLILLLSGVAGVLLSIWMMTKILKKKYPGFRIALIRDEGFVR